MLALKVLTQSVCRRGYTNPEDVKHLQIIVSCYKSLWLKKEEERKLREQEDESLYTFKTKTYCENEESEDKQNRREIDEVFTQFDQEYKDLDQEKAQESLSSETKQESRETTVKTFLESDMTEFYRMHQLVVSSAPNALHVLDTLDNAEWEQVDKKIENVKIVSESYNISAEVANLAELCGKWVISTRKFRNCI